MNLSFYKRLLYRRSHRRFIQMSLIGLSLIFPFQNCGKPMQASGVNPTQESSLSTPITPVSGAAPIITITSQIPSLIQTQSVSLSFKVVSSNSLKSVSCQLDTNAPVNCSGLSVSFSSLLDGDHKILIDAVDSNGQKSLTSAVLFRVDSTAPVITFNQSPATLTSSLSADFLYSIADNLSGVAKAECALDSAVFEICSSTSYSKAVTAGAHNFKIKATDVAGNTSGLSSFSWTVNTSAASVTLTQKPNAITNSVAASFSFTGSVANSTFQCKLDNAALANCVSPMAYSNLSSQSHTFSVQAKDNLGNLSALSSYSWVVDNVAPTLPVLKASVAALTNLKNVSITFSSTDALSGLSGFQCSQNGAAYVACASPLNLSALADGNYSINIRGIDNATNVSAISNVAFAVDSTLPTLNFTQTPVSSTVNSATFAFSAADSVSGILSIECSLDNAAFAVCVSPVNLTNLSVLAHNYRVQVKDKAGNISLITHNWTVSSAVPIDELALGKTLYTTNCAQCHGAVATSTKLGRTAAQISLGISTVGQMSGLKFLTTTEIGYIEKALAISVPPPVPSTLAGRVVIVGYGGLKMTTANQGASWLYNNSDVTNGGDDYYLYRGVHYANGLFVASGGGTPINGSQFGRITTSPDGVTWTTRKTTNSNWVGGVTYGNGRWVATGGWGLVMYSVDGINWTETSYGSYQMRGITFGNGVFISYGDGGSRTKSTDGITWSNVSSTMGSYEEITFGKNYFYGIKGSNVYQSTDGNSWALVPGLASDTFKSLSYSNGTLYFVASGGTYYSKDGSTWTKGAASPEGSAVYNSNGTYFSLGWARYYKSTDLKTWQSVSVSSNSPQTMVVVDP